MEVYYMGNRYRLTDILIIVCMLIVFCSLSAYLSYKTGIKQGYETGYTTGHIEKYNEGYDKGKETGYTEGYNAGFESGLEKPRGFNLKNPTYREMKEFLATDTTDSREFIDDEFTCTDFSAEVNNNAEAIGFRCAIVYINYPEAGHTIVAFDTVDEGIIFIEPQYDDEVVLEEGKSYSKINKYSPPEQDDTILRYVIIW
jgi:hypothetical protein